MRMLLSWKIELIMQLKMISSNIKVTPVTVRHHLLK